MTPLEAAAHYGSRNKAADALGLGRTRFKEMCKIAEYLALGGSLPPMETGTLNPAPNLPPVSHSAIKPRVSIRADMPATRVLCVGDTHDSPRLPDKSRFRWIARHAAKTRPDRIVHIGDFGDWHSCSRHEQAGSMGYACKPSFRQDIESCEEALTAIYKVIGSDIPMDLTEGNHEGWVQSYEETHPTLEGGFYQQMQDLWARYGWRPHKYGEYLFIDGTAFTHVPRNILGKPYGGKNIENAIGNDATFSVVCGHTHRGGYKRVPKIGPAQSIEVLNLGSAMPQDWVAPYAQLATTGWTYGVYDLEIRAGHITAHNFIPMSKLEELYAD